MENYVTRSIMSDVPEYSILLRARSVHKKPTRFEVLCACTAPGNVPVKFFCGFLWFGFVLCCVGTGSGVVWCVVFCGFLWFFVVWFCFVL